MSTKRLPKMRRRNRYAAEVALLCCALTIALLIL